MNFPPRLPAGGGKPSSESSGSAVSRQPAETTPAAQQQAAGRGTNQPPPATTAWSIGNPWAFRSTTNPPSPAASTTAILATSSDAQRREQVRPASGSELRDTTIAFLRSISLSDRESILREVYTNQDWNVRTYRSITEHMYRFMHSKSRFPCPHEADLKAALVELEEHQAHIKTFDQTHHAERSRHRCEKQQLEEQITALHQKVQEMEVLYLRSVSNVGGGLEPIADRTFADRFTDYHVSVNKWCRHNLRGREKQAESALPGEVRAVLLGRCTKDQLRTLSLARVAEVLVWNTVEIYALCPWAGPVAPSAKARDIAGLEKVGKKFQRDDKPEHNGKIDFWRSYTASLAFQGIHFENDIKQCVTCLMDSVLSDIVSLVFPDADAPELALDEKALYNILYEVVVTAAEMKCQRGLFDIENVQLGRNFHPKTMEDCSGVEWDEDARKRGLVVKAVLSDGIIKRPYRNAEEVVGRACKARVMVGPA